jgi:phage/plasmid-like protein (TIGR03299 family)
MVATTQPARNVSPAGFPVAWMRSGTPIDEKIESVDHLLEQTGLDWGVEKTPIRTDDAGGTRVPRRFAVVRTDRRNRADGVLGVVGPGYQCVDNRTALGFFHELVTRAGATYFRAGSIGQGERVYVIARLPVPFEVVPGDEVIRSLLLITSHGGSRALTVVLSPIRMVCTNQITMALRKGWGVSIRHGSGAGMRMQDGPKIIDRLHRGYMRAAEVMRQMAATHLDRWQFGEFVNRVFPLPKEEELRAGIARKRERLLDLYESGMGSEFGKGNLWGAFNAVTEMVDWAEPSRRLRDPVRSALFGDGALLKQRAFDIASHMIHQN